MGKQTGETATIKGHRASMTTTDFGLPTCDNRLTARTNKWTWVGAKVSFSFGSSNKRWAIIIKTILKGVSIIRRDESCSQRAVGQSLLKVIVLLLFRLFLAEAANQLGWQVILQCAKPVFA